MKQTVIGIFQNKTEAETAIEQLERTGFNKSNIDITQGSSSQSANREKTKDRDSISEFFSSLFDSNDEADKYSNVAKNSECVVTVHANDSDEAIRAAEVLDSYGAMDVDDQNANAGHGDSKLERHLSDSDSDESIPVIEEEMEVGKRQVETGKTRIRSRIIEKPVEERLRLREEHVNVSRNEVNREASDAELKNFKEMDMEITEHAEVPVVNKSTRVVEEISVDKDVEEHEETVRDTVRKTEVDIDHDERDQDRRNRTGGDRDKDYSSDDDRY